MTDIAKRLETMADMIIMGEKIAFGSDSALMREARAEIERLRAAVMAEREACAVIADESDMRLVSPANNDARVYYEGGAQDASESIAAAIRARTGKTMETET